MNDREFEAKLEEIAELLHVGCGAFGECTGLCSDCERAIIREFRAARGGIPESAALRHAYVLAMYCLQSHGYKDDEVRIAADAILTLHTKRNTK